MALVGDSKGAPRQLEYLALERRTTDPRRVLRADRELLRGVFTSFKVDDYRGDDLAATAGSAAAGACCVSAHTPAVQGHKQGED